MSEDSTKYAPALEGVAPRQNPSIGRMVHYVAYGTPGGEFPAGTHRAAIITEVDSAQEQDGYPYVSLCVMNPTGLFFNLHVHHDPTAQSPGSWHWPERV